MSEIQKPITIAQSEFVTGLSDLINNSGLPPFVILPILKDAYSEVSAIAQRQLENDIRTYHQAVCQANEAAKERNNEDKTNE